MRRVFPIVMALAGAALLAGCETMPTPQPAPSRPAARPLPPPPPPPPPPTPADEFAWSTGRGPNTLTVVLNYQPAPGQQWTCATFEQALMPETSYSRGRIATLYGSPDRAVRSVAEVRTRSAANAGPDFAQFVRQATCDAQNSFTFRDLPNGAYFVIARVRAVRPAGAGEVAIMQRVEVRGGETVRVVLPQGAPPPRAAPARRPAR